MANVFDPKAKRWSIDSVHTATPIDAQDLRVQAIRWVVPSGGAIGNQAVIAEPDGSTVLWSSINVNGTTYESVDNAKRRWPLGFTVPTLSAGTLFIYME